MSETVTDQDLQIFKSARRQGVEPTPCENSEIRCGRIDQQTQEFEPNMLEPGQDFWLDLITKALLCEQCGLSLRYARKKAAERGEPIEGATIL